MLKTVTVKGVECALVPPEIDKRYEILAALAKEIGLAPNCCGMCPECPKEDERCSGSCRENVYVDAKWVPILIMRGVKFKETDHE